MAQGQTPSSSSKPVLVTGATGLVGRAVVARLLRDKVPVKAQVRDLAVFHALTASDCQAPEQVCKLEFESASSGDMQRLVTDCSAVVHTAALVHQPDAPYREYELINVRTTQQLAEAAASAGVDTFVFLSTIGVCGQGPFDMIREDQPLKPVTPYAVSKAESERWLAGFDRFRRVVILRPPLVFGEGDRGNLIKLIRQITRGRYFHIGPRRTRKSLIYSQDLASVISQCLTKLSGGNSVFNAANPEPILLSALASKIAQCLGRRIGFVTLPQPLVVSGARLAERVLGARSPVTIEQLERLTTTTTCSVDRLVESTGFQPDFSLEDALKAEITWARASGLL